MGAKTSSRRKTVGVVIPLRRVSEELSTLGTAYGAASGSSTAFDRNDLSGNVLAKGITSWELKFEGCRLQPDSSEPSADMDLATWS